MASRALDEEKVPVDEEEKVPVDDKSNGAAAAEATDEALNPVATQFRESINEALSPRQSLPGFADPRIERISGVELPPWFIDRCRRAYMSVSFDSTAGCKVLGITSTSYGEGKTSVAIGVAMAMAVDTNKPTLLLECDLATPSLHKFLGLDQGRGLSEWLEGDSRLRVVRGAATVPNVFMIPAGAPQPEPARLFFQLVDREVIVGLRQTFASVVIDLPPTANLSYGALAFGLADRLLIVARSGVTTAQDLDNSVRSVGKDRVSGIVLNGTDFRTPAWLRALL